MFGESGGILGTPAGFGRPRKTTRAAPPRAASGERPPSSRIRPGAAARLKNEPEPWAPGDWPKRIADLEKPTPKTPRKTTPPSPITHTRTHTQESTTIFAHTYGIFPLVVSVWESEPPAAHPLEACWPDPPSVRAFPPELRTKPQRSAHLVFGVQVAIFRPW